MTTAAREAVCVEVVGALESAGVDCLVLKGPVIARWLYSDGTPRPYRDIDVLVDPRRLPDAYEVLLGLGFAPPAPAYVEDVPGHAQAWHRYADEAWLDLHYTLTGVQVHPFELWDALWHRRKSMEIAGREMAVLDPAARALHLALHLAQDRLGQHKKRTDLRRALDQLDPSVWEEAAALAGAVSAAAAMGAGLRQVADGGVELAAALGLPEVDRVDLAVRAGSGPVGTDAFAFLLARPGVTGKVRYAVAKAFPPPWFLRAWTPVARRWGPVGLVLGYGQRVGWLARTTPGAARGWWRARKQLREPQEVARG